MKFRNVGILIFPAAEVLDVMGPYEVFNVSNGETEAPFFRTLLVAETDGLVCLRGGLEVRPHETYASCPPLDILVIPGGNGRRTQMHHEPTLDFVRRQAETAEIVLTVCTGAFIAGNAGLLRPGMAATTHPEAYDEFALAFPDVLLVRDPNVLFTDNDQRLVVSGGIAAGITASLYVTGLLRGQDFAALTARDMVFPYDPEHPQGVRLR